MLLVNLVARRWQTDHIRIEINCHTLFALFTLVLLVLLSEWIIVIVF